MLCFFFDFGLCGQIREVRPKVTLVVRMAAQLLTTITLWTGNSKQMD